MHKPFFPDRKGGTVDELRQDVKDVLPEFGRFVKENVTIKTTSTPIAHGLGYAPRMALVELRENAHWWRSAAPDAKCVYLQASVELIANVEFIP